MSAPIPDSQQQDESEYKVVEKSRSEIQAEIKQVIASKATLEPIPTGYEVDDEETSSLFARIFEALFFWL